LFFDSNKCGGGVEKKERTCLFLSLSSVIR